MTKERFPEPLAPRIGALEFSGVVDLEDEDEIDGAMFVGTTFDVRADFVAFRESHFQQVSFTGSVLDNLTVADVIFEDCEFSATAMEAASLTRVRFVRCRMSGVNAASLKGRDVHFVECKIDHANFRLSELQRSVFVDCDLSETSFNEASIATSQMRNCQLQRSEFTFVKLQGLALHDSTLDGMHGAEYLRNAVVGADQVLTLGALLMANVGIEIKDPDSP